MNKTCCGSDRKSGHTREGEGMNAKKWDVYVYGDVNIDIVIPGVEKFPEPGQEDEVSVMETFVGGGAALSHNHHFKWWFVFDPIRVLCLHA